MDYEAMIKDRNEKNGYAALTGVTITEISEWHAVGEIIVKDGHKNIIHSVHGGCLFTLADTVAGAAAASCGDFSTTVQGDIHYLNPAMDSKKLICAATAVKTGRKVSVFNTEITDDRGILIATAVFTYYRLK